MITNAVKLHYSGKILKQGNKFYTGSFFKPLKSGKSLCLDYKNGLLRKAVLSNSENGIKTYNYDNNKRLINVKQNGKDIFVKNIENKMGLNFRQTEIINDSIYKIYDENKQLIISRIMPKAITSSFIRFYNPKTQSDIIKEERFFISNLVCDDGNYYLKPDTGSSSMPKLEWIKSVYKDLKNKHTCVMDKHDNRIITTLKDKDGEILAKSDTLLDENNIPVWDHISGGDELSIDMKYFNSGDKNSRLMSIIKTKKTKAAFEKEFDANKNVIRERKIECGKDGSITQINIFERKFDKNNLMTEEKKFKETDSGKKLIYTVKKEYNAQKLPIKEEFYNAKDELESSEYYVYDKSGKLRVSGYHEYGEFPESGYEVRDRNGVLRKRSKLYDGEISEEHYDKNSLYIKKIKKDEESGIIYKYDYLYDSDKKNKIKTVKRDENDNIVLTAEFFNESDKKTIVYKGEKGELLLKEFIKQDENGYNHYYTNSEGKRCSFIEKIMLVHDVDL